MATSTETDLKANLSELTKIPAKEFERHFRDWMERDDVARGLQAKLRCDLIKNFNKTTLGKHILAQTTTTLGSSTHRLTLSPLILALNTLVAEFLYAQNCHFSLSVFCTEVPFRNTLPDFESIHHFRFSASEIEEIWRAVAGTDRNAPNLQKLITQKYSNGSSSLLLEVIKALVEQKPVEAFSRTGSTQTNVEQKARPELATVSVQATPSKEDAPGTARAVRVDNDFRHLNKYLLTLSQRVKEMTAEFAQLQHQRLLPRPRLLKSAHSRHYEKLNRSMERITNNLKQITLAKRKSKRIGAIVEAIESLTREFAKCAVRFQRVSQSAEGERKKNIRLEKQTEKETHEKSYVDWLREMRNSANGQKFLERIEISVQKMLNKHKEQLHKEAEIRLRHLRALMKIHYKQKLMMHLSRHGPSAVSGEGGNINEKVELQLKQLEMKHLELQQKVRESSFEVVGVPSRSLRGNRSEDGAAKEQRGGSQETIKDLKSSPKPLGPTRATERPAHIPPQDIVYTQLQLQTIIKDIAEQDRNVDHIIYDAKLRLQQLESESNQLEQNFLSYLERQKFEKMATERTARQSGRATNVDLKRIRKQYNQPRHVIRPAEVASDEEYLMAKEQLKEQRNEDRMESRSPGAAKFVGSLSSAEMKNAILEAKEKFFEDERKFRHKAERECQPDLTEFALNLSEEPMEPLHYCTSDSTSKLTLEDPVIENKPTEVALNSRLPELRLKGQPLNDGGGSRSMNEVKCQLFPSNGAKGDLSKGDLKKTEESDITRKSSGNKEIITEQQRTSGRNTEHLTIENSENAVIANATNTRSTKGATTSEVLQQSMAKMEQLFGQYQSRPQQQIVEMTDATDTRQPQNTRLRETIWDINKSTTTTSTSTTTTTDEEEEKGDLGHREQILPTGSSKEQLQLRPVPSISDNSSDSGRDGTKFQTTDKAPDEDREIGEIQSERATNPANLFVAVESASTSTSNSSSELQFSTGHNSKDVAAISGDSDSEF